MNDHFEKLLHDAGCSPKVVAHCRAVRETALDYARRNPEVDCALVEAGAMLHDIGRGSTHAIDHAQRGADLLRSKGIDERIARIVECHTGAGLTADEATMLGLEPRQSIPETTEEKIVCHADNRIAGKKRVNIEDTLASGIHLPRKIRHRMYRLAQEVELLCP